MISPPSILARAARRPNNRLVEFGCMNVCGVQAGLTAMTEVNDISFLNHVTLPFHPQQSFVSSGREASKCQQLVAMDHLGSDETALDIGVNDSCGFESRGSSSNGP